ncbi:uncharacterized protein TRIREDRAFT_108806 [Trichoderma reesei QM6a]|uniref:Predicted protein n=1 Tax=Hypocrea jecorina (strain QM6a) TaxID=431241 RepID=G0RMT5_HYPJQ|nr:uncharacterized protein TRIREDRAFT_108806 [Trichoderma reesei QM6a]EGR47535.1 predicted protein [Trichoderma reesei QM6a]
MSSSFPVFAVHFKMSQQSPQVKKIYNGKSERTGQLRLPRHCSPSPLRINHAQNRPPVNINHHLLPILFLLLLLQGIAIPTPFTHIPPFQKRQRAALLSSMKLAPRPLMPAPDPQPRLPDPRVGQQPDQPFQRGPLKDALLFAQKRPRAGLRPDFIVVVAAVAAAATVLVHEQGEIRQFSSDGHVLQEGAQVIPQPPAQPIDAHFQSSYSAPCFLREKKEGASCVAEEEEEELFLGLWAMPVGGAASLRVAVVVVVVVVVLGVFCCVVDEAPDVGGVVAGEIEEEGVCRSVEERVGDGVEGGVGEEDGEGVDGEAGGGGAGAEGDDAVFGGCEEVGEDEGEDVDGEVEEVQRFGHIGRNEAGLWSECEVG